MTAFARVRVLGLVAAVLGCSGCSLLSGVHVESVDASVQKPSNVALYVAVTDHGEPVTDLEPKSFRVYENGELLDPEISGRTLLPRALVTEERALLLVDLSGSPSPEQRTIYARAVEAFVRKLQGSMAVSVRAYDGGPTLKLVGEYPRGSSNPAATALTKLTSKDASRNLNGALVAGLEQLDTAIQAERKPIRLGTLVVFARGADLAGRVPGEKTSDALGTTKHDVIGIGIGPDTPYLDFAEGGVIHAEAEDTLPIAFEEAGSRVAATHDKYYLVSYCSPARAGQRSVRLEVVRVDKEGNEHSGDLHYDFDASGFGPGCKAETPPRFEHPAAPKSGPSPAQVNQAPGANGDVVPPPPSGDYAQ